MTSETQSSIRIGWKSVDITPEEQPIRLVGQFYARVSEGVKDPLTATAMALESEQSGTSTAVILVSCDLIGIQEVLREAVLAEVHSRLPELRKACVILNATHTHTGPAFHATQKSPSEGGWRSWPGVDLPVAEESAYLRLMVDRLATAITEAWQSRAPGSVGFGLGHAVIGYNRRLAYRNGESRMYGNANDPQFSHVEGYEDHSLNLLGTWDTKGELTGLLVNVACPSQVSEHLFQISADFWHETREELRRRFGKDLPVLAQCASAGDQSPRPMLDKPAEERMRHLMGRDMRADIAHRIANAVEAVLPYIAKEKSPHPILASQCETIQLSRRLLRDSDLEEARTEAETWSQQYDALRKDLEAHPEKREKPHWYVDISIAYRRMNWHQGVVERYEMERREPKISAEITTVRIGDLAIATNPFELYLDFAMRIRARSPATQTLTVQLVGPGSYLPTERAVAGGSYGAVPPSTPVGPEGGAELVEQTLAMLQSLWK